MSAVIAYNEDNYSDFEWFEGLAVIRFYADWANPVYRTSLSLNSWPLIMLK